MENDEKEFICFNAKISHIVLFYIFASMHMQLLVSYILFIVKFQIQTRKVSNLIIILFLYSN
jgi:hypothetical protein